MPEPRVDFFGTRDEVVAFLDASMAEVPDGELFGAKVYLRSTIAALPESWWFGVSIAINPVGDHTGAPIDGAYQIHAGYTASPVDPRALAVPEPA